MKPFSIFFVFALFFLVILPGQVLAQGQFDKEIVAHPLGDTKLKMDGKLDEDFWKSLDPSGGFKMTVPIEGGDPTEKTEIRIAFDEKNLYIGAILYDSNPSGIKAFQRRRDAPLRTDDRFMWIFDTFNDKQRGYFFEINPRALRGDGLLASGSGRSVNKDWDGIWNAWTYIGDFGWSAEIKIPFQTLNFDAKADRWGINFQRTVRRKNEELVWIGHKRNQGLFRPQNAGFMSGLQDPSQGVGLEVVPYVVGRNTSVYDDEEETHDQKTTGDFGFDVNYNITPSLKASFTYNTDFAQTEVDDRQINLTRFPLRFPEKRDFFLEGASILQFAPRSGVDPYFSRRIGLNSGVPVPVNFGARLLGNVGRNNIYLLHVNTARQDELKPEHFTVGRYRLDFWKESSVGVIYTRRSTNESDPDIDSLQTRNTAGVDINLNTSEFLGDNVLQFNAFFVGHNTDNPFDNVTNLWDRSSRGVRLNFPNQPWNAWVSYREFGEEYDPAVGFNRRNGFRRVNPGIRFTPLFEKSDVIRSVQWGVFFEHLVSLDWKLLTQRLEFTLSEIVFETGDRIELEVARRFEFLDEPFDILRDSTVIVPPGEYANWLYSINASSASFRRVSVGAGVETGGFWTGNIADYSFRLAFRPIPGINLNAEYRHTRVTAEGSGFNTNLVRADIGFDFTPDISLSSNVQYDDVSNIIGTNTRFRWIITPGTDVFLVYNHNWLDSPLERSMLTLQRGVALKLVYTHRF